MTAQIEHLSAELQRFLSALETIGLTKELLPLYLVHHPVGTLNHYGAR